MKYGKPYGKPFLQLLDFLNKRIAKQVTDVATPSRFNCNLTASDNRLYAPTGTSYEDLTFGISAVGSDDADPTSGGFVEMPESGAETSD